MGLALCHTLPRDPLQRIAAALALTASLLQLIALAGGANDNRLEWLTLNTAAGTSFQATMMDIVLSGTVVCPGTTGAGAAACAAFRTQGRITAALQGTSCALTAALSLIVGCGIVRRVQKNTRLLAAVAAASLLPFVFAIAGCGVMGGSFKTNAEDVAAAVTSSGASVTYSHGAALCIAACVLYGLAWALATLKLLLFVVENKRLKDQVKEEAAARAPHGADEANACAIRVDHEIMVDERLALRLVNDDWQRQKAIWMERRRAVMKVLTDRGLNTAAAREAFIGGHHRPTDKPPQPHESGGTADPAFQLEEITPERVAEMHKKTHPQTNSKKPQPPQRDNGYSPADVEGHSGSATADVSPPSLENTPPS